jgi:hypothetical protein
VKIQGQLSSILKVKVGLKQGDALSTILFNIAVEKGIKILKLTQMEQFLIEQDNI